MVHRMHLPGEGYGPTCSTQPRLAFYKLAWGFSPAITPICDGAEKRINSCLRSNPAVQGGQGSPCVSCII